MARRVAANSAVLTQPRATQAYFDEMQDLLLDSTVEMRYVARGLKRSLQKTPPAQTTNNREVGAASRSIARDTNRAALLLGMAASLLARAEQTHKVMFVPKRNNQNQQNNRTAARRRNGGNSNAAAA